MKKSFFLSCIARLRKIFFCFRSIAVIDDSEEDIVNSKSKCKMLKELSSVGVHHKKLTIFLLLQTFDCFYRRNVLNPILYQATHLILFRSISNFSSLKRWLNSYHIPLHSNETLHEIYQNYVQGQRWAYLLLDLSPSLPHPRAYSQILICDSRPMLLFSVE